MPASTALGAGRALPRPDLAALAVILDQHRRARADQIEALLCTTTGPTPTRELVAARGVLRELDAALGRMFDDTYGTCCRCLDAIPAERLYAQPTTRLCPPCLNESLPQQASC
jgi:RNA polymerase-binding transcription factor DksA